MLKPVPSFAHPLSRCQHYSSPTPTRDMASRGFLLVSVSSCNHMLRGRRRYSTFPEPQRDIKSNKEPIPIGSAPLSKPKVDLRPAPKRVVKEVRSSNPPPPPTPVDQELNKPTMGSSTSASAEAQQSSEHLGVFESTKYDFHEAVRRGVFKPPPDGTSQPGVLWHNLKQYFWFYYGGVKSILVTNRHQVAAIRRRIRDAKSEGEDASMTRAEIRFIQQYRRDVLKSVYLITSSIFYS